MTRRPERDMKPGLAGVLVCLLVIVACGPRPGPRDGFAPEDSAEELIALLDRQTGSLAPGLAGAEVYQSQPAARREMVALSDPLRSNIFHALRTTASQRGVAIVPDGRLDSAMDDLARALRDDEQPSSAAVEFLLSHYGVVEPFPRLRVLRIHRAGEGQIAGSLARSFAPPGHDRLLSVGIGVNRASSFTSVVVATQPKHLDLAPVQRRFPSAATITLAGRLLGRFRDPHLYVTDPAGKATRHPLNNQPGGFTASVTCAQGDGRYQVEVFGQDQQGPRVLANFPVYCGAAPPAEYQGEVSYVAYAIPVDEAEAKLLALVNQARASAGLGPVAGDSELAEVARGHSEDMRDHRFVAHISPTTGTPMDRARAAGLSPRRLLENIGTAGSVEEVHAGLMRSPGHRSAILDPHVTHVGVGVVVDTPQDGPIAIFATELFR